MTDTQETIADIIAKIRALSNPISDGIIAINGRSIADRLEAAHKRERGDCAKLRELAELVSHMNDDGYWNGSASICALVSNAKTALSAPPRNCDVAQDWLHDLYVKFKPPASVKREMPPEWVDAVMAFCRWLVAPATEKEGGNDGNK